jgi:hypothetical protein
LQTFRTFDHLQYERFRPFTVPERSAFLTVSYLFWSLKGHITNGRKRS